MNQTPECLILMGGGCCKEERTDDRAAIRALVTQLTKYRSARRCDCDRCEAVQALLDTHAAAIQRAREGE